MIELDIKQQVEGGEGEKKDKTCVNYFSGIRPPHVSISIVFIGIIIVVILYYINGGIDNLSPDVKFYARVGSVFLIMGGVMLITYDIFREESVLDGLKEYGVMGLLLRMCYRYKNVMIPLEIIGILLPSAYFIGSPVDRKNGYLVSFNVGLVVILGHYGILFAYWFYCFYKKYRLEAENFRKFLEKEDFSGGKLQKALRENKRMQKGLKKFSNNLLQFHFLELNLILLFIIEVFALADLARVQPSEYFTQDNVAFSTFVPCIVVFWIFVFPFRAVNSITVDLQAMYLHDITSDNILRITESEKKNDFKQPFFDNGTDNNTCCTRSSSCFSRECCLA